MRFKPIPGAIETLFGFFLVLPGAMLYFYLLGELMLATGPNWQSQRFAPDTRVESDGGEGIKRCLPHRE